MMRIDDVEQPGLGVARRRAGSVMSTMVMALGGGFAGLAAAGYLLFTEGLWPPEDLRRLIEPIAAVAPSAGPPPLQTAPPAAPVAAAPSPHFQFLSQPQLGLTPLGGGAGPVVRQDAAAPGAAPAPHAQR
ncbi:MAG: hypothetical protein AB7K86_21340 [Rhodospirillales bacterium]